MQPVYFFAFSQVSPLYLRRRAVLKKQKGGVSGVVVVNDDKFRQILFSQVQSTNQHTINMKTLFILVILLAVQKMAISSEMNKKSAATEWWKGASTSFLPSSPAAIEVAKEKQNKEEGPDHLTNGRHGILSIYFPRSFF